tara:strand:- start:5885 stop:6439 length:555 start_codon:yes stop_codon:yes gene_type:complete
MAASNTYKSEDSVLDYFKNLDKSSYKWGVIIYKDGLYHIHDYRLTESQQQTDEEMQKSVLSLRAEIEDDNNKFLQFTDKYINFINHYYILFVKYVNEEITLKQSVRCWLHANDHSGSVSYGLDSNNILLYKNRQYIGRFYPGLWILDIDQYVDVIDSDDDWMYEDYGSEDEYYHDYYNNLPNNE